MFKLFLFSKSAQLGGFCLNVACLMDHVLSGKKPVTGSFDLNVQEGDVFLSFAHYSSVKEVDRNDLETLRQISEVTDRFAFCSNIQSPLLIDQKGYFVSQKKNLGFDLALHRDVLRKLNGLQLWPKYLILTNNSLIWDSPNGLREQIDQCVRLSNSAGKSIIFMTESLQPFHHLQSYFVFIDTRNVEVQNLLYTTFMKVRNWRYKRTAVFFGEKKFLTELRNHGETVVMFPITDLWQACLSNRNRDLKTSEWILQFLNPTHHLASEMKLLGARFQKKPRPTVKTKIFDAFFMEKSSA